MQGIGGQETGLHRPARRRVRVNGARTSPIVQDVPAATVHDAALFLAQVPRPISWLKLQDLLYYAQAWHLVWDQELMFASPVTAVADGVRIAEIHDRLEGTFEVTPAQLRHGRIERLGESRIKTLSGIVKFYGDKSHYRLAEQIMTESPWRLARAAGGDCTIDAGNMLRYYRDN